MADPISWLTKIDTTLLKHKVPATIHDDLKMDVLELLRISYTEGLDEATAITNKRNMVAVLIASGSTLQKAIEIAEKIIQSVK